MVGYHAIENTISHQGTTTGTDLQGAEDEETNTSEENSNAEARVLLSLPVNRGENNVRCKEDIGLKRYIPKQSY